MSTRNRQQRCHCAARTFVSQSHQYGITEEDSNAKNMNYDAAEAIKELLEQGPREAKKHLMDWEVEDFEGENVLFYKGKNYVPINPKVRRKIV
jgi:hypothetical protein